jgi:hypothetical protein
MSVAIAAIVLLFVSGDAANKNDLRDLVIAR